MGTSKNLVPAAFMRKKQGGHRLLSFAHTLLLLSRILRSSILSSERLVWTNDSGARHPFEVLRGTLKPIALRVKAPATRGFRVCIVPGTDMARRSTIRPIRGPHSPALLAILGHGMPYLPKGT